MNEAAPPFNPGSAAGLSPVGDRLRAAREDRGLSLAEVAARTRVNVRNLGAIEAGAFEGLPAAPYSVGFVKAYAREVGLDGAALSADFRREWDGASVRPVEQVRYEPSDPARLPSKVLAWTAAVIALLLIAGYGVWRSGVLTGDDADGRARMAAGTDVAPAPVAAPAARPAPVAPAPNPAGGPVLLTATEPAWIKVYERGGAVLFQGELSPGRSYQVPATARDPLIRLGRAEVMQVTVGGRYVPALGPPARTVKDVSLKAEALLALPGKPQQLVPQI